MHSYELRVEKNKLIKTCFDEFNYASLVKAFAREPFNKLKGSLKIEILSN